VLINLVAIMSKNQDQHVTVEMRREPLIGDYFWVGVRRQRGAWIPARIIALPKKSANKKQYVTCSSGPPLWRICSIPLVLLSMNLFLTCC